MIALLALLLRLAVLAVFTFGFVVLFEHGTKNYLDHAKADAIVIQHWLEAKLGTGLFTPTTPAAATPEQTPELPSTPERPPATALTDTPTVTSEATSTDAPVTPPAAPEAPAPTESLQNQPIDDQLAPSPSR